MFIISIATLITKLKEPVSNLGAQSGTNVLVDASQLMYHINWPMQSTVGQILTNMNTYLSDYSDSDEVFVIFDRYDGLSAKDHERNRRAGTGSETHTLSLNSILPPRDEILKNKNNKKQLNELICTFPSNSNAQFISSFESIVSHDEADISLISYMLHAAEKGAKSIRILSDDTDVFVLAVYWCWKKNIKSSVYIEKWDHTLLDVSKTVKGLGARCANILGVHALSGCDTVSFAFGKGKATAVSILKNKDLPDMDAVFGNETATQDQILTVGRDFILKLYGQAEAASMHEARFNLFRKRQKPPPLKCLPPTDANLVLYCLRAHLQVMLWKSADVRSPPVVNICDYGWYIQEIKDAHGNILQIPQPYIAKIDAAPPELMDVVSCNCSSTEPCKTKQCSCHKQGLPCTYYCKCNSICKNPFSTHDIEEIAPDGNLDMEDIEEIAPDGNLDGEEDIIDEG